LHTASDIHLLVAFYDLEVGQLDGELIVLDITGQLFPNLYLHRVLGGVIVRLDSQVVINTSYYLCIMCKVARQTRVTRTPTQLISQAHGRYVT